MVPDESMKTVFDYLLKVVLFLVSFRWDPENEPFFMFQVYPRCPVLPSVFGFSIHTFVS